MRGLFAVFRDYAFRLWACLPVMILVMACAGTVYVVMTRAEHQDQVIENLEFGMRYRVEPFYRTWTRQLPQYWMGILACAFGGLLFTWLFRERIVAYVDRWVYNDKQE